MLSTETLAGRSPLAWERLADIEMRSIVFLERPLWQASAFHLVVGRKGVGKGTMLAELAARFTRGELGDKPNVVWIASEDSAAIDIKPRLVAADGDPERVVIVKEWLQLPAHIARLGDTLAEVSEVGLVIIDPVGNHIAGKNSNSETDIRDAIAPLNNFADEHGVTTIGVRHLTEKEATAGAIAAILGSSAWVQVPRVVIGIARDNEDASVSHVQCLTGNRLPPEKSGRRFGITGVRLEGLDEPVTCAVWLGESGKDFEALIGQSRGEQSKSAEAHNLILDLLDDAPDRRMESDELDAMVKAATGLAHQTIRNIRGALVREGLIQAWPEKDEVGQVMRWMVERTNPPGPAGVTGPGSPETGITSSSSQNSLNTPETAASPEYPKTVTGISLLPPQTPATDSASTDVVLVAGSGANGFTQHEFELLLDAQALVDAGEAGWEADRTSHRGATHWECSCGSAISLREPHCPWCKHAFSEEHRRPRATRNEAA